MWSLFWVFVIDLGYLSFCLLVMIWSVINCSCGFFTFRVGWDCLGGFVVFVCSVCVRFEWLCYILPFIVVLCVLWLLLMTLVVGLVNW